MDINSWFEAKVLKAGQQHKQTKIFEIKTFAALPPKWRRNISSPGSAPKPDLFALALNFFLNFYLFMIVTEREREAETQAEGEAGSMHREPDVGFNPRSPGSRPGPKAGAKPLRHPGIPLRFF